MQGIFWVNIGFVYFFFIPFYGIPHFICKIKAFSYLEISARFVWIFLDDPKVGINGFFELLEFKEFISFLSIGLSKDICSRKNDYRE